MPLLTLEAEDLKHRWSNCYVALPKQKKVGVFVNFATPDGSSLLLTVNGTEEVVPLEDVEFKVPQNQYVNLLHSREIHGVYVYKTGARFYKKGFSLGSHGSQSSKMFDAVSPFVGKVRALNCVDEQALIFLGDQILGPNARLLSSFQICKSKLLHNVLAHRLLIENDDFNSIYEASELVLLGKSLGLAISPAFFLGLSSNKDYDLELYCGLIPIGFVKHKTKTIFVNGPITQEVSDFLISSGQTEYEIISV